MSVRRPFGIQFWRHKNLFRKTRSTMAEGGGCASPGCDKVVEQRLACPKCMQLGLQPVYFCSQECFKENYSSHKQVHTLAKQALAANTYVQQRTIILMVVCTH
jgi:hypothetical protein